MLRLKTRPQFVAVLAGQIVAKTNHFALHLRVPSELVQSNAFANDELMVEHSDVRLGAMVPKRWAKRAVTRNMIKRQIYSVGNSYGHCLLQCAHVVRLRKSFDKSIYISATSDALREAVRTEVELLFITAVNDIAKPS